MVQNNKVLTVSYGTFSCTLEGFDDSFETMKAIAEYFRDLAADDRYFGSEPPQPDAQMLTRIAQRDQTQRVEASQNDQGLLLRATDATSTPSSHPAPAAATPPAPAPAETPAPAPDSAAEFFAQSDTSQTAAPDSIAAKLQRIRAVVSHADGAPSRYNEDDGLDAGFVTPAEPKVDAISAAFAAGALSPEDLQDEDTEPAPAPELAEPELAAPELDEPQLAAPEVSEPETTTPDIAEPEAATPDATAPEMAELEVAEPEMVEPELPAVLPTDEIATDAPAEDSVEEVSQEVAAEDEPEISTDDVLFTETEDDAETEAEPDEILNILSDDLTEDDIFGPEEDTNSDQPVLSAADEAKLLDEITLVESELAKRTAPHLPETGELEEDVSRLMDTAGVRMDDPETTGQRETYSHLRTAVAATEAERGKDDAAAKSPDQDYRGDLESVVSPRRPEVQVTSIRPEADVAPLKLVAEQRIDTDDADLGPVMPRRVKSEQEEAADEEGGFAQFAQEQGAQSLPDLLEAAAAYLSFIEGQEQFSRPQLMNKVRSLKQDAFNREESLRTFGQLLRDGKIEKAGGGRFAASNQIGFRPDDKRAAG